jgi:hypothetical protein
LHIAGQFGWDELVARMCDATGYGSFTKGASSLRRAQPIKDTSFPASSDYSAFLELVQKCLYQGVKIDLEELTGHKLLAAIGSLVMASRRGSASQVITLNFDDVLETYLEYYGFDVASIIDERHWAPTSDVIIYHPHGFLPYQRERKRSDKIVLSSDEFYKVITDTPDNAWRLLLLSLLRTHTLLHIGLSGEDMNIESLMPKVGPLHAGLPKEAAYLAVRFALASEANKNRDIIQVSKTNGIFTHLLERWSDLPGFLFSICQKARELRSMQALIGG